MADVTAALLKLIFLFNLVLLAVGIFISVQGIKTTKIVTQSGEGYDELEKLVSSLSMISRILIIIGVVISFVAFFGCCGAFIESPSVLSWYIFFLVILIIFQVAVGYYVHQTKGIDKDEAKVIFWNAIKKYEKHEKYKSFVDSTQSWLRCCGATAADNWVNIGLKNPPASCCFGNTDPCELSKSFKKNCADGIDELVKDFQSQNVWYIAVVISLQVIVIIFTFYARNTVRERQDILSYEY